MQANENEIWAGVIAKLTRLTPLDETDRQLVSALPLSLEAVPSGRFLVREGQETNRCCLLVEGFACRHKTSAMGGRQIVSFHLRGDILDIQHLLLSVADHNVQTISRAMVAWIPKDALQRLALERPNIGRALWQDTLIDASIFREWVLNVGRRDAKTRIAHMLCEFVARARTVGLASQERCELPLTQEEIGDATGLTAVHVNRMLRLLREEGLLSLGRGELQIVDWNGLQQVAAFDPAYLHSAA